MVDPVTKRKYDLSRDSDVAVARQLILRDRPKLLVLSPPCTMFSILQNLTWRGDPVAQERFTQRKAAAVKLLETAVLLARVQMLVGGVFLFEHPASAFKAMKNEDRASTNRTSEIENQTSAIEVERRES